MLPLRDQLPTRRTPVVNYALIAANILGFVWMRLVIGAGVHPGRLLVAWGLVPAKFVADPIDGAVTILTSMFMHDPTSLAHIGGNMLFLWIFGDNVEDAMGRGRYAAFYLLSGLMAAAAQVLIDPTSPVPMVGASGAISGVLAAYGVLYPRSPITVLNPIPLLWLFFGLFFQLPAWFIILEYFVVNLFSGVGSLSAAGAGVAFFAHIGGFVAGFALVKPFMSGRQQREPDRWQGFRYPHRGRPPPPRHRGPWDF